MNEANEVGKKRKDKLKKLMARDVEKTQKLQVANKKAEEMEQQIWNMVSSKGSGCPSCVPCLSCVCISAILKRCCMSCCPWLFGMLG